MVRQSLSKQAEQLSWRKIAPQGYRQRLALIWQLARSLLGRSVQPLPNFWERLQQWRSTIDWDAWSDDDPWADVRDRDPGRDVTL